MGSIDNWPSKGACDAKGKTKEGASQSLTQCVDFSRKVVSLYAVDAADTVIKIRIPGLRGLG